jgi:hypothetical protein
LTLPHVFFPFSPEIGDNYQSETVIHSISILDLDDLVYRSYTVDIARTSFFPGIITIFAREILRTLLDAREQKRVTLIERSMARDLKKNSRQRFFLTENRSSATVELDLSWPDRRHVTTRVSHGTRRELSRALLPRRAKRASSSIMIGDSLTSTPSYSKRVRVISRDLRQDDRRSARMPHS